MIRLAPAAILIAAFLLPSCALLSLLAEREDFIRIQGGRFIHKGAPYFYAGTNLWYGAYLGSPGLTGDRQRLLRELDALKANEILNLRILAASEDSDIKRSLKPAIQRAPGVIDDSLLQGLDFVLAEMAKRDMHAVLYLANYWEWSGGLVQYNAWAGSGGIDPYDPRQGWGAFMDSAATFYSNPRAVSLYRDYVRMLIGRKNSVNGRMYAHDPTIMAWQLANEPRPGRDNDLGRKNLPSYYRWIEETAQFIHGLDTNHLVCSGSEGTIGSLQSEEIFVNAHKTPHIDYLNFHLWPLNWGWYDPAKKDSTYPETEEKTIAYINQHIAIARLLGKPLVLEEFGLGRDGGKLLPGTPTETRDHFYRLVYQLVEDSVNSGALLAGSNFWAWGGEAVGQNGDGMWKTGDPYLGDPPQEPQGMNSVYASDSSTMKIISDHGRKLRQFSDRIRQTAIR